jgi:serine/threonine protein phosphatase PrpC
MAKNKNKVSLLEMPYPDAPGYINSVLRNGVEIGLCALQGTNKYDTTWEYQSFSVNTAKEFSRLSPDEKESVLNATFADLQEEADELYTGASALVATAWLDFQGDVKILTANAGDCMAYLVTLIDGKAEVRKLNEVHVPDSIINIVEYNRVKTLRQTSDQLSKVSFIQEKAKKLWLTRSLGNNYAETEGLIHEPEILWESQANEPGMQTFLITASYALTSYNHLMQRQLMTMADIGEIVRAHSQQPVHEIAAELVERAARDFPSTKLKPVRDCVAISIAAVTEKPVFLGVFTGQEYVSTAEAAHRNFFPLLHKNIELVTRTHFNGKEALAVSLERNDWEMVVYILMTLSDCKHLDEEILGRINFCRNELCAAFIKTVSAAVFVEQLRMLGSVLNRHNAFGIILHKPRHPLMFKFTLHEFEGEKVTASIYKIRQKFKNVLSPDLSPSPSP